MGVAASSAKRAVRNWNATNRAIKRLDKEAKMREKAVNRPKITPKQQGEDNLLHAKNDNLEKRVFSLDIKSEGVKKNILPEGFDYVPNSTRKLPQRFEVGSPIPDPRIEFGFAIPDVIPKGSITISQAINMIKCYQLNIKTIPQLSEEYDLDPQIVTSIYMRALNSLKCAFRNAPLMGLRRWCYNTDKKIIQGSFDGRVSNAIRGYLSKNNDFLLCEFDRLSKIVMSDRSAEAKDHLWRLSSLKTLLDIKQRLQTLITLDADSANLLQELDDGSDAVFQQMAASEAASRREQINYFENQILELILPPDPNAFCSSVRLQLIAGAGGLEAAMFARDLFNMYEAYIIQRGWSIYPGEGGINALSDTDCPIHNTEVIVEASDPSDTVYTCLRWEAGVHRVQRVPVTSKLNKIHTSTVAVTVLPAVDEADIDLLPEDLEWDVFRSSGAGGQHVNKTESAVRVRHKPTGHVAVCQDDRSQHANREAALKTLKAKIAKEASLKQVESELATRRSQMGSLERSDRIRTYNYQQDRITDHRLGKSWNDLASCMRQNIPLIDEAAQALDEVYILNSLNSLKKPYFLN
ncbi:unnamed protein product [Rodentolepis nana]|uniref:RF_PROK_I domain-containing protein n=1 Tax=Rodentolepis nana TaxID=102285 RepID=A0A0R3TLQ5_RODNA|nr:unnamed protein product [Rodentolepis nana]